MINKFTIVYEIFLFLMNFNLCLNNRRTNNNNNDDQKKSSSSNNQEKFLYTFFGVLVSLALILLIVKCIIKTNNERRRAILRSSNHNRNDRQSNNDNDDIQEFPPYYYILSQIKKTNPLLSIIIDMLLQIGIDDSCEYILRKCLELIIYDNKKDDFHQNCTICLENFTCASLTYKTNCSHIFHKDCIVKQLKTNLGELKKKLENNENIKEIGIFCPNCKKDLIVEKPQSRKVSEVSRWTIGCSPESDECFTPTSSTPYRSEYSTGTMSRKRIQKIKEINGTENSVIVNNIVIEGFEEI